MQRQSKGCPPARVTGTHLPPRPLCYAHYLINQSRRQPTTQISSKKICFASKLIQIPRVALLLAWRKIPCRPACPYPSTACCCSTGKGDADEACIYLPAEQSRESHRHSMSQASSPPWAGRNHACIRQRLASVRCPLRSNPRRRSDDG